MCDAHCNHDVHRFASGVVLVRIDPVARGHVMAGQYDCGQGVIVVERGTGRIAEIMAGTTEQLDALRRDTEGMWP